MDKYEVNSLIRIVEIYELLRNDGQASSIELANKYGKHIGTIKKDIGFINEALGPAAPAIVYDKPSKLYKMKNDANRLFYCFILLTMLYGSRSLPKQDLNHLTHYIFDALQASERREIKKVTESYEVSYMPMIEEPIINCMRDLYDCILHNKIVEITYTNANLLTKTFPIAPLSITYDEGFFYCIADKNLNNGGQMIRNYRIDRIKKHQLKKQKFTRPLHGHQYFEAGRHSNYSFMMHTGESLVTAAIKIEPNISSYLKSKFPIHTYLRREGDREIYSVTVSDEESLLFWLLQQRTWAEVLSPQGLRDKLRNVIADLARMYDVT